MPRLLEDRAIGGSLSDVATRLYAGQTPGNVLQVGADGKSLVLGPVPANASGATGPTGPGVGATGATGPAGSAVISNVGPRQILFGSVGSYTWTVPSNTNYIIVNAVGGGSGGGLGSPDSAGDQSPTAATTGETGQAGGSLRAEAQVTPGGTVTITVGAGGLGTQANPPGFSFPGTSTAVGGLLAVDGDAGVTNIVCNGGTLQGTPSTTIPRASSTPSGLFSPFLQEYGYGGTGGYGYGAPGNGGGGAVLIEWVEVT